MLAVFRGEAQPREHLVGMYGSPGTRYFKAMIRQGPWKYIWLANGGREQLFNLQDDPREETNLVCEHSGQVAEMKACLIATLARRESTRPALQEGALYQLEFEPFERTRIKQFARGVTDFNQPVLAR